LVIFLKGNRFPKLVWGKGGSKPNLKLGFKPWRKEKKFWGKKRLPSNPQGKDTNY